MLKTVTLTLALAAAFAAAGTLTADAKMRHNRMVSTTMTSGFVSESCEALRDAASRQDRRGDNYYKNQFIQCINR